ncbi:NAD(P)/FAD-dependent oxidoreductase [Luteipulveratus mongoliensis]|uniref:Pyridine nucleotide-disulfide oxidoreductase n=1 Tax=Luteipulveratus mongoliensis TaxID=571913 RepID=A0A0K1JKX1_9MICO|nr:FAD-dependent oxidoreductase [Luteipulveratus mongoliensis]AKU17379.1 pyridine nucleotide-disulfide oxidoreductase [Luteipulveratus mongoliensis]
MDRLVVVGASLAGLRAVEAARRQGYGGAITLIGAEEHLPYDRPQLSKAFLGIDGPDAVTPYRTESELGGELDVELMLGAPADHLDAESRVVSVADRQVSYDGLVVATGAASRVLPGSAHLSGVHYLRTVDDALALRTALHGSPRVVIIGAGFIGSEIASAARKRDLDVTVVEALDLPLVRSIGPDVGAACAELHRRNGTALRLGASTAGFESSEGRVTGVRLEDGTILPADLVVVGIGVRPVTDWLAGSGVPLHADGGIICDATLATGVPGVYAAGDVAHVANPLFDGDLMRLEHWTNAAEQGAAAARHLLDPGAASPLSSVPYFWSDWYDHRIQFVGTPRADDVVVTRSEIDGFTALYRRRDQLVGALTINRPRDIMKLRRRIVQRCAWDDAVASAA